MLGVCYYPEHWPETMWAEDARRMVALGISHVRIGEFAWSRIEPRRDAFDWGWLDRALNVLGNAGLKVVLGTPTATPPKWLMDEHPDIAPIDEEGRPRGFGSRRHYTFSSQTYWRESARIVEAIARRYGEHPAVVGWQTDNEYGCHDTIMSWGAEDLRAFRQWLRRTYQSTDQLNEAWGSVFWSMEVTEFDQVSLPNLTVTETNPATRLDFRRFQSQQVAAYDRMQCDIIRAHSPGRWTTTNMMGFFTEFDHWPVGENHDFVSWDSYPIGFVERFPFSEDERNRWATTSHPDIAPFHHDLYRGIGGGRFWVMEQQPGPVNWAPWNPVPKPGMVRLWTWEALAHGADVVSYFRWRQMPAAQEQMHAGLNLPGLQELSVGGREAESVGRELAGLGALPPNEQASVALVFDYEAQWVLDIQRQGADFRYFELAFRWYEAVRTIGLDVDIVRPGQSLEGYRLVLVPSLPTVSDAAEQAFRDSSAVVLYGPRTGSKTRHFSIPDQLPPGALRDLLGIRITEVSSLRPGLSEAVDGLVSGAAIRWVEHMDVASTALAHFADGHCALAANGRHHYLAAWPDARLLSTTLELLCKRADLKAHALPPGIRMRRRGSLHFAFNYGAESWEIPNDVELVLGERILAPQGVAIWRV